jgi:hypothetical protein
MKIDINFDLNLDLLFVIYLLGSVKLREIQEVNVKDL